MKNAIIYTCRKENDKSSAKASASNKEKLLEYCKIKGIYVDVCFEEVISHDKEPRSTFDYALDYISICYGTVKVDTFLITSWNQLSTSPAKCLAMYRKMEKLDVTIRAIEQPVNFNDPDDLDFLALYLSIPAI